MSPSIVIRRFATVSEARVLCSLLSSHGFVASIDNAEHAAQDWGIVPAMDGVAVRIPSAEREEVEAFIAVVLKTAPNQMRELFGEIDPPKKRHRIAGWSMLLIYFGVIQLIGAVLLVWMHRIVPASWIPTTEQNGTFVQIQSGGGAPGVEPTIEGLVFVGMLAYFVVLEIWHLKSVNRKKDPTV